ncbi:MAG: PTS system mannose/fructose/sorbose family transporter subunit IID [Syntrophales bacterium]|nr:PTS system mannose/fructose/sorbose family transporter subunit IID [Syntrophales bacterium]
MDKGTLRSIFFRSFLLNGSLNFWKMQNLGFCYSLLPLLKEINSDRTSFLLRHLKYFSTHPYLAPAVIGSVVKSEEEGEKVEGEVNRIKEAFMGPYAAIGDQFFWGRWLPFAGLISAGLAWVEFSLAPILFFILFVPLQFLVRWRGFISGYRLGEKGFTYIQGLNLAQHSHSVRRWTVITCVFILVLWARYVYTAHEDILQPIIYYGLGLITCLVGFILARIGVSIFFTFYGAAAFFCFLSL